MSEGNDPSDTFSHPELYYATDNCNSAPDLMPQTILVAFNPIEEMTVYVMKCRYQ